MLPVSGVVEANELHGDVHMKSVFFKQDCTANIMSDADVIREELVLEVLNRFLWRNINGTLVEVQDSNSES